MSYLIVRNKRGFLFIKETARDEDQITGLPEKWWDTDKYVNMSFPISDIISELGDYPQFGAAYGCAIEPYLSTEEHEKVGSISYFRDVSAKEHKKLFNAFKYVFKAFKKCGLTSVFPLNVEIRHRKGKYDGMYHYINDPDESDIMTLRPLEFDSVYLSEVIAHEMGHAIWFNLVSNKVKSHWINYFHDKVKVKRVAKKDLLSIMQAINKTSSSSVKEFSFELEEDDRLILEHIVKHIIRIHNLSICDLNIMLEQNIKFTKLWPDELEISELDELLSEYASKSVAELFAESVRVKIMCKKLPKDVEKLLSKTLVAAANRSIN